MNKDGGPAPGEVEAVLQLASVPALPAGAMERLMARVEATPQAVAGRAAVLPRHRLWRYAAAVPLAASLALGAWLGATGHMDVLLSGAAAGDEAAVDDLGGVGDAYAEEATI